MLKGKCVVTMMYPQCFLLMTIFKGSYIATSQGIVFNNKVKFERSDVYIIEDHFQPIKCLKTHLCYHIMHFPPLIQQLYSS